MPDDMEIPILDHKAPPVTVREVGIHLIYMSKNKADISKKLDEMGGMFAHRQELLDAIMQRKTDQQIICADLTELTARINKIETDRNKVITWIAVAFIIMLVVLVLAQYGLDRYFKV